MAISKKDFSDMINTIQEGLRGLDKIGHRHHGLFEWKLGDIGTVPQASANAMRGQYVQLVELANKIADALEEPR